MEAENLGAGDTYVIFIFQVPRHLKFIHSTFLMHFQSARQSVSIIS